MEFKDLLAFKKALILAIDIFELSKSIPKEERYSLTDQIRRSSMSVCVKIAEAYRKRQYPFHFVLILSDANMENSETPVWLDFASACRYLMNDEYEKLLQQNQELGKLINYMIQHSEKFGSKNFNSMF